jgi:polyphosphate glucokinase
MPPRRVIGIDAGGTKLLGGVVDDDLVVHHRVHRTWRGADRSETLDIIFEAVEEVRAAAPEVAAVGFGIPALVEASTGVARWSTHLPLEGVRFRDVMSERLGLPVIVDNDANAALLAESRFGAARDVRHAVLVALGTGIGSALLLDGQLVPNTELGHLELDGHDAEKKASSAAKDNEGLSYKQWARRVQRYLRHVEKLFTPDLIVVGGGVSKHADEFLHLVDIETEIVPARLRNRAGIVGAALWAAEAPGSSG